MVEAKIKARCRFGCRAGCRSGCRAKIPKALILRHFSLSDNHDNQYYKEKGNSKKIVSPDKEKRFSEETWAQFKENARLVTGEWVNLPGEGGKTVHFDAYNLAVYKKKFTHFP